MPRKIVLATRIFEKAGDGTAFFRAMLNRYPLRATVSADDAKDIRSRRVRDAGMARLVQQSPADGAHRQHPPGRGRGALLLHARRAQTGSVTQTQ